MVSFETKWPIFWHFFLVVTAIRYPNDRCGQNDCSTQLWDGISPGFSRDCVQYLSSFTKAPAIPLELEEEAKFSVSISPYVAQLYITGSSWDVSALNISFAIHMEGVDGLAIKIKHKNVIKCRFFDFRDQRRFISRPISFFYDCLRYLVESKLQNVEMDFISLPSHEHISYNVYIPPIMLKKTPCDWQPVIMVFCGSLAKGVIKVKFSRPPSQFLISSCTVELVDNSTNEIISNSIVSTNNTEDMLVAKFLLVPEGLYKVVVKPYLENCLFTTTEVFQVQHFKQVLDITTVILICIIFVFIICSFAVYKVCYVSHKLSVTVKRALIVHSFDNQEHEEFVTAFVDFLNQSSRFKVSTIYESEDLIDECWEADLIIFLISQGLLITLDKDDDRQIRIGHKLPTQLKNASSHIFYEFFHTEHFHKKEKCKIIFKYAKNLKISDYIEERTGTRFNLPEDYNSFLSFSHGIFTTISSNMFCPQFTIDFNSSLTEKLKRVPVADEKTDVVCFVPKEKTEESESQKLCEESVVEIHSASSFDDSEFTEGGRMNSIADFEGSSDDGSNEGVDQPLFDGKSPDNVGGIEGGRMNSTADFEGSSDDGSNEGEDRSLFDGKSPDNVGGITETEELFARV
ncbi:hypothetical protein JTE90_024799 [Oedothorax gibbosus]|uniref:SEFIR domain-containing protein n=1 Tax=Oedothorax gibbosus TaxID=931172 RepID=A0AAV6U0F4_9ARAC|nr:hypothetical protein JTE90_024799 [Oedothorax gibbosus]